MKATEQYFPVVLFSMLCKEVFFFFFFGGGGGGVLVNEILKCDHSMEKVLSSTFLWCVIVPYKVVLTF